MASFYLKMEEDKGLVNWGSVSFLVSLLVALAWVNFTKPRIQVIPTTEVENTQTGSTMVRYFSDSTTFHIVPNHITEVTETVPRWGSLEVVKYTY